MKQNEKLTALYTYVRDVLKTAPGEEDCGKAEAEMYAELANFTNAFAEYAKEAQIEIPQDDEGIAVTSKVRREDKPEFFGQIIDIFEDFLEAKGVDIENPEKKEAVEDGEDPDSICILYGTDYGDLENAVESTMFNWGLVSVEW